MDPLTVSLVAGIATTIVTLLASVWRLFAKRVAERDLIREMLMRERELTQLRAELQHQQLEAAEYERRLVEEVRKAVFALDASRHKALLEAIEQSSNAGQLRYAEKILAETAKQAAEAK